MGSFAQMVVDNEFAGSIHRLRNGVNAEIEALAVEVIGAVMNGSRNFLGQKHTMKYLKSGEVYLTRLSERGSWEGWEKTGRVGMVDRAQAEAEHILQEHQVPPLDNVQENELDRLMIFAHQELGY